MLLWSEHLSHIFALHGKILPPPRMIRVEKVEQSFKLITVGILDISIGEEGRDLTL